MSQGSDDRRRALTLALRDIDVDLDLDGPAAPPRSNGELAFDEPWQGRVFATTMALCEVGVIEYADFRDQLIAAIGERDLSADPVDEYWSAWQDAIERLLAERAICTADEIAARGRAHDIDHGPEAGGARSVGRGRAPAAWPSCVSSPEGPDHVEQPVELALGVEVVR